MQKLMRFSRQREEILRFLHQNNCHPTAEVIYQETRKVIPSISLGTVYRNLLMLEKEGEIVRLQVGKHSDFYDGNPVLHYHFVCRKCGEVFDIDIHHMEKFSIDDLNRFASGSTGFKVDAHSLVFYGVCGNCG